MSGPDAPWAIETRAITKRFGDFVAVDAIDLQVRKGELFGLLGPNGAGKTTLVRMLTGLIPITSGQGIVAGIDVQAHPAALRRSIGVVPQALTSDLDLTCYENLDIYARFFDMGRAERHARIEELLRRVELWDRRRSLVQTFSGGMRRRLEIARGMIHRPRVLFLDEPTIGLDPQSRHVIWDLLRDLRRGDGRSDGKTGAGDDGGLTISLTTHYLDEAEILCDRVAIVDHGKIAALGTPAELKSMIPGSDTIDLTLAAAPDAGLLGELRGLPGVRQVDVDGARLKIRADGGAQLLPRLVEATQQRRCEVVAASMSRISLEEVFIHFTGRSLRDEGPARPGPGIRRFS